MGAASTSAHDDSTPSRSVDDALAYLPFLAEEPRTVTDLPGGLTNVNVRVTTPSYDVVVRISDPSSGLLGIDRAAEHANSRSAAESGAAPPVVAFVPDASLLVVQFVTGRTLTDDDLHDPDTLAAVAQTCRQLHSGPRFCTDFDMYDVLTGYLDTVVERGFRLPRRYLDLMPKARRVVAALETTPVAAVPCHNDLLPANLIDDGQRIWLIDFEYAGNNDPFFELGNIWSEAALPVELLDVLVTAYVGEPRPDLVARARLYGLLAKYGWTLWASIQDASSSQNFDFWTWGMQKYDRAVAEFDGHDFERLLDAAAQPTGGNACPTPHR